MSSKAGRPPYFRSVKAMQVKIDEYFERCKGELLKDAEDNYVFNRYGELVYINAEPPTITGLALYLGFDSRTSFYNYEAKEEFLYTLTRARSRCEDYAAQRLFDRDGAAGAEFYLKSAFKWRDSEEEHELKCEQLEFEKMKWEQTLELKKRELALKERAEGLDADGDEQVVIKIDLPTDEAGLPAGEAGLD